MTAKSMRDAGNWHCLVATVIFMKYSTHEIEIWFIHSSESGWVGHIISWSKHSANVFVSLQIFATNASTAHAIHIYLGLFINIVGYASHHCNVHYAHITHVPYQIAIFHFFLVMVLFFYRIIRLHAVQYNLVSNQNTHEINTQQRKKQKKKKTNKHKTDSDTQAQYTIFHTQYVGAADLCFYVCCRRRCGESIRVFRLCDLAPHNKWIHKFSRKIGWTKWAREKNVMAPFC